MQSLRLLWPKQPRWSYSAGLASSSIRRGASQWRLPGMAGGIPVKVKQSIGLDDEPNWVIVSEHNTDGWPNGGLSNVPGKPGVFSYGSIPPGLFAQIKEKFLDLARRKKSRSVRR
jgi:hypothetical protein